VKVLGVEVQPAEVDKEPVLDIPAIVMTDAAEASDGPALAASDATSSKPKARNARASKAASRQGRAKRRTRPASKAATTSLPERRTGRTKAAAPRESPKRPRDGSIGRETLAAVEALVSQGKTKSEAFKQIARDTGKNSGTVAAAYYRVARLNGTVKPRPPRARAAVTPRARRQSGPRSVFRGRAASIGQDVDHIVGQLIASVQALTEAVKAQDAEVRELRSRLDGGRSLLN
jgi:hypothetical protein